jgi:hypothetical protein
MDATDKKPVPPYVAYKTLVNFLDRFKQGIPGRIDRGLMGSMSGAAQSQVTTALRYLGMISENNIPNSMMKRYVAGEEAERKAALREMLEKSYPFIFNGSFDLSIATAGMLRDAFVENTTATGDTVGRCIAFLKDAAVDAGIVVSSFILQKGARSASGVKRRPAPRKEDAKTPERLAHKQDHLPPAPPPIAIPALSSLLLSGLFQRLPKPQTAWPKEERERWLLTLTNVLLLEYPEQ